MIMELLPSSISYSLHSALMFFFLFFFSGPLTLHSILYTDLLQQGGWQKVTAPA